MTNKKTMTMTKTMAMTNTFRKHPQRVTHFEDDVPNFFETPVKIRYL